MLFLLFESHSHFIPVIMYIIMLKISLECRSLVCQYNSAIKKTCVKGRNTGSIPRPKELTLTWTCLKYFTFKQFYIKIYFSLV